ncbi:hypothetical protein FNT36_19055 [Hymenobacter setariae]|uniref:Tetratricopeptide repeat protein n=1 Tax=Hymenobacter setariae TaxID=2594794 RepID=A0A558BP56_9BACT|nr:hypothetical protein [Hymenobacter setariae]TVT38300.1 hypothetical protein FNT36_19055 [Hymenobacter setariae]
MPKFTFSFSAGIALVAFALAAPAAQAQTSDFVSISLASNTPVLTSNQPGLSISEEPVQRLSTPSAPAAHADYFNDSHKDLKQALAWMQETNAMHPEYQTMYTEARIRLQLKDYAGAHATALEAQKLALAAANSEYARHSEEVAIQAKAKLK